MSLKVFDLQCGQGHVFEGWFSASNSFEKQASRGLLNCPVCGDDAIERKLSAPRLNLGKSEATAAFDSVTGDSADHGNAVMASPQLAKLQARIMQHLRKMVNESEDVGPRFAQEALKMHHGEAEERAIRGTASHEERQELHEEGVSVITVPDFLNDDQLQ